MSSQVARLGVAALSIVFVLGCAANSAHEKDHEEKITVAAAPSGVQEAVKRLAGENKVEKLSKEMENGKVVYEVEWDAGGVEHTATIGENGEVIEQEAEVKVADLPAAVAAAVKSKYPEGKLEEANTLTTGGKTVYEVIVTAGKDKHELTVGAAGDVQADKAKAAKSEKDEEHEEKDKDGKDKD